MAVQHLYFARTVQHGAQLHAALEQFERSFTTLNEIRGTMALMIDGDGSQAAHFDYMTEKFGFASSAIAKSAWDELNSMLFKLNTNSSVDSVNAAMLQAFSKFR